MGTIDSKQFQMTYKSIVFFGLLSVNSLPEQYIVVRLPNEKIDLNNPEKNGNNGLNIDGDDYASNVDGNIVGSKITLGCDNDVNMHGHVTNSVIEYQCGNQTKKNYKW
eukprot:TRINITY_DN7164_c0_g1_i2.p1 TRINITY_DN7164_c0_g1~~TRINITY_DN7164_c0_g1_i2.p1  ORF type:complete len:108 (-),score=7.67 TRINITY_DN7164_c0_g1_i2:527-850(-)